MAYFTALYLLDREYGGAEEGGWWYDTGELKGEIKEHTTKKEAWAFEEKENKIKREKYYGFGVYSMGYEGGYTEYRTFECKGIMQIPSYFPEERPYYC